MKEYAEKCCADYASSSRSSCKWCQKQIEKAALRLGKLLRKSGEEIKE